MSSGHVAFVGSLPCPASTMWTQQSPAVPSLFPETLFYREKSLRNGLPRARKMMGSLAEFETDSVLVSVLLVFVSLFYPGRRDMILLLMCS